MHVPPAARLLAARRAKLVLYSDAGPAFLFPHMEKFVREVLALLAD